MAGGREGDRFSGNVDDGERSGGEKEPGTLAQHAGHLAEDIGDGDAGVEQRGDHAPYQGHVRGGRNAVAGDVADDQRDPVAVEEKAFVPVAADRVGLTGWEIPSRYLDPGHRGKRAEQAAMHLDDELVLGVVALGALRWWRCTGPRRRRVRSRAWRRTLSARSRRSRWRRPVCRPRDEVATMRWPGRRRRRCRRGSPETGRGRTRGQGEGRLAGASRRGDREGRAQRYVGVPVRDLGREERAVEQPQRLPVRVEEGQVGVVGADARGGTEGDELGDLDARRGQRKGSGQPSGHLDPNARGQLPRRMQVVVLRTCESRVGSSKAAWQGTSAANRWTRSAAFSRLCDYAGPRRFTPQLAARGRRAPSGCHTDQGSSGAAQLAVSRLGPTTSARRARQWSCLRTSARTPGESMKEWFAEP